MQFSEENKCHSEAMTASNSKDLIGSQKLATWLCSFKEMNPYSKSCIINPQSGINNRYLQNLPFNQIFDIMNDATFLPANKVFSGRMRDINEKDLDAFKPSSIA